jgi:hypothetical protein
MSRVDQIREIGIFLLLIILLGISRSSTAGVESCSFSQKKLPKIGALEIAPYLLVEDGRLSGTEAFKNLVPISEDWSGRQDKTNKVYLYKKYGSLTAPGKWTVLVIDKLSGSLEPEGGFWFKEHDRLMASYLKQVKTSLDGSSIQLSFLRINKLANQDMILGSRSFSTICIGRTFPETKKKGVEDMCYDRLLYLEHGKGVGYPKYEAVRDWVSGVTTSVCQRYTQEKELPITLLVLPSGQYYDLPNRTAHETISTLKILIEDHGGFATLNQQIKPVEIPLAYRSVFSKNRFETIVVNFMDIQEDMLAHIKQNIPRSYRVASSIMNGTGRDAENIDDYFLDHEFRETQ